MIAILDALRAFLASPFGSVLLPKLAVIMIDLLDGRLDDEKAVYQLAEVILGSGLAPTVLKAYLTPDAVRRAEAIADVAEEASLRIEAMKNGQ